MLRMTAALPLALALVACQSSPKPAPDAPEPAPEVRSPSELAPDADASASGEVTRSGVLVFDPIEPTKSVRSYLGDELRLEGDGEPIVLAASEAVSREALIALAGSRVTVRVLRHAPTVPSPDESYPTDMDGKPMPRPARWEVLAITPVK